MSNDLEFSKKIKTLRREKLLMSQTEFAQFLGISYGSVNRYENCRSSPTYKIKRKLVRLMIKNGIEVK